MRLLTCTRLTAVMAVALLLPDFTRGQAKKDEGKPVVIETVDSVKLKGTFFASTKGREMPTVLMLHNFEQKKGGSSQAGGWQDFAKKLNAAGYSVLTFDFRGHGESTGVDSAFWTFPHNKNLPGANKATPPETISQTTFQTIYYNLLVNDVAAAKAFLDRKNDSGEVNTSSLIVIGAGEGAAVGVLWMHSEWKRRKAIIPPGALTAPAYPFCKLDEPEGKDLAAGVWLTISPTLAGRNVPVSTWMRELGNTNKVPQVFVYGKEDMKGDQQALSQLQRIRADYKRGAKPPKEYEYTGEYAVPGTKLAAENLLQKSLDTDTWIIDKYLGPLMEKRGNIEPKERQFDKNMYYWSFTANNTLQASDSRMSSKAPKPLPLTLFNLTSP